jgi:transcriptional regulator with XRE-family HTH domain
MSGSPLDTVALGVTAPDESAQTPATPAERLGARIRHVRHDRSLTLVQLAELSGLSQPFLSQVETGRARPSFASIDKIARALGTSQLELFAALADAPDASSIDGVDHERPRTAGPFSEGSVSVLAPDARAFTPVEFAADNRDFGEYFIHDEEEFVYVIEGAVDVDLGGRLLRRSAGGFFFSSAQTPHRWRSADGARYRVLVVKEKIGAPGVAD